jgi:tRNA dimethylallyltransferase
MSRKIRLMIGGATASGKTRVAIAVARQLGLEILNCDSGQVRKGLRVGIAAPTQEESEQVPHHMLGYVPLDEQYSVAQFLEAAQAILDTPGPDLLAVGGTGQYLSGLWRGIDPVPAPDPKLRARAEELWLQLGPAGCLAELAKLGADPPRDASNPQRMSRSLERAWALQRGDALKGHPPVCPDAPVFALGWPRDQLHRRIHDRLDAMIPPWREEIRNLKAQGVSLNAPGLQAIGYKSLWQAPEGPLSRFVIADIAAATRQYAKRQETWMRTQLPSRWIPASSDNAGMVQAIVDALG